MLTDHFRTNAPLHDLGTLDERWAGIVSPRYDAATVRTYVHEQFLEQAEDYARDYLATWYWKGLLEKARVHFTARAQNAERILDLGSGAGNTVFPLLELFPGASVVASDLSLPLLKALDRYRQAHFPKRDCYLLQLNAEDGLFEAGQFDLVAGGAILHHLVAPDKAIAQAHAALAPGGTAVFFEPFEAGNQIIALVLKHLLAMNASQAERIPEDVTGFFTRYCADFTRRTRAETRAQAFAELDDKWIFTKGWVERVARAAGFADVVIHPLHTIDNMCLDQINTLLRLGPKRPMEVLPGWAIDHIREVDSQFSPELRSDLLIEGAIVLRKQ